MFITPLADSISGTMVKLPSFNPELLSASSSMPANFTTSVLVSALASMIPSKPSTQTNLKSSLVRLVIRALTRTNKAETLDLIALMESLTMILAVPLSGKGTASSKSKIIASDAKVAALVINLILFPGTKSIERKTIGYASPFKILVKVVAIS